jgi:predicted nucleic acid-binding protein
MSQLAFFDTNILVYADDAAAPAKREKAITLFRDHLRRGTAVLSLQVLQEYFAAATRKLRLAPEAAQRKIEILGRARVIRFRRGLREWPCCTARTCSTDLRRRGCAS